MSTNHPELVVVRTYLNEIEAELARSALEAADIDAAVRTDDAGGARPAMWMSGVRLLVRAEDAERADQILGPAS